MRLLCWVFGHSVVQYMFQGGEHPFDCDPNRCWSCLDLYVCEDCWAWMTWNGRRFVRRPEPATAIVRKF